AGILEKLGFLGLARAGNADRIFVKVPSWRPDVEGKADLVEEIVRIAGVDNVAATPMLREEPAVTKPILTLPQKRKALARRALAASGLVEAVTWSFISKDQATLFGGGSAALALANPIAADLSDMRPSLLPGLIAAAQRNGDRGLRDAALFEVGQIFLGSGEADQRTSAAMIRRGTATRGGAGRHWSQPVRPVDVFDAKADALSLLATLGVPARNLQFAAKGPAWAHPGRSGAFQFGPKKIVGYFGEVHPKVLEALGAEGPLVAAEIILDEIPAPKAKPTKAKERLELSEFMAVERDFAFLVDRAIAAADIVRAAESAERGLVADVAVFDVYEGAGIPEGQKSVAIAVTLQPRQHTLTDADIDAAADKIIGEVARKTGAKLRG
ncbi:MAG TPA: phenylalanine--tRNA ligase subunit beta, partial [Beijerinckiaceae bacterium]|nr:phenylalanine--tRNA ligase subunit beta [Beijerinckiaceae bacterium]